MSPPTGDQLVAFAMTQRGRAKGYERENANAYTTWFYGDNTAACWCLIFVCYCLNHFGALGLIGGKIAYVPSLKGRVRPKWHTSKSLIRKGDPVTFDFNRTGSPEHVGIFIKWLNSAKTQFQSIEGNTGDDLSRPVPGTGRTCSGTSSPAWPSPARHRTPASSTPTPRAGLCRPAPM